jgi:Tat protein secretion system quality control protein TatD with DNase activity
VTETAKVLAGVKGATDSETASKTTSNALHLFNKMPMGFE